MADRSWNSATVDILRFLLLATAGIFLVAGVGGAMLSLVVTTPGTTTGGAVVTACVVLVGCMTAAFVLMAIAAMLRLMAVQIRQQQYVQGTVESLQQSILLLQETTAQLPAQLANVTPQQMVTAERPAGDSPATAEMLDVLTQLRDLMLMTEPQRTERGRQHWLRRKESLTQSIERHIAAGEWTVADNQIAELSTAAPGDAMVDELKERLRTAQSTQLASALEDAQGKLRHLMSITAWAQAGEVVRSLRTQFPHAPEVAALAEEVQRERDIFDRETVHRLFLDLKDATEHRQWRRAFQTAEELIRRYPDEKKVEKLKVDITTIRENAEAQERREKEELFKDLLKRQRYEDARQVAHDVINKYPASTAAAELNKLLPKVEELVRQANFGRQQ